MSESLVTTIGDATIGSQSEVLARAKRQRWFELLLVLLVSFGGFFLNSLYLLRNGPSAAPNMSNFRWTIGILHESTALILLGYVLSRRRLRFKDLGLHWSLRCVGASVKLIFVSYLMYGFGAAAVRGLQYAIQGSAAMGPTGKDFFAHPSIAAVPFFLLNPFFEELIVRAYLMTEITDLPALQHSLLSSAFSSSFPITCITVGWCSLSLLSIRSLRVVLRTLTARATGDSCA